MRCNQQYHILQRQVYAGGALYTQLQPSHTKSIIYCKKTYVHDVSLILSWIKSNLIEKFIITQMSSSSSSSRFAIRSTLSQSPGPNPHWHISLYTRLAFLHEHKGFGI